MAEEEEEFVSVELAPGCFKMGTDRKSHLTTLCSSEEEEEEEEEEE